MLLMQLGDAIHRDAVPHTQCAEHGEWVHVDDHDDHGSTPARLVAAALRMSSLDSTRMADQADADTPHLHGHEHCTVCIGSREHQAEVSVAGQLMVLVGPLEASSRGSEAQVAFTAYPLSRAPKTSPPALLA